MKKILITICLLLLVGCTSTNPYDFHSRDDILNYTMMDYGDNVEIMIDGDNYFYDYSDVSYFVKQGYSDTTRMIGKINGVYYGINKNHQMISYHIELKNALNDFKECSYKKEISTNYFECFEDFSTRRIKYDDNREITQYEYLLLGVEQTGESYYNINSTSVVLPEYEDVTNLELIKILFPDITTSIDDDNDEYFEYNGLTIQLTHRESDNYQYLEKDGKNLRLSVFETHLKLDWKHKISLELTSITEEEYLASPYAISEANLEAILNIIRYYKYPELYFEK